MTDEIDIASLQIAWETEGRVLSAAQKAATIPPGAPGICDECGEHRARVVNGYCAPCRDGWRGSVGA